MPILVHWPTHLQVVLGTHGSWFVSVLSVCTVGAAYPMQVLFVCCVCTVYTCNQSINFNVHTCTATLGAATLGGSSTRVRQHYGTARVGYSNTRVQQHYGTATLGYRSTRVQQH